MSNTKLDNSAISKHLGQTSDYSSTYDPGLLVRERRQNNRDHLDIDSNNLPFVGYDTWNAYEISALTFRGMPVVGVAKIIYPSDSEYIVESKSLKLYLNSFNMTLLGDDTYEVKHKMIEIVTTDLSDLLETDVSFNIFLNSSLYYEDLHKYNGLIKRYKVLEDSNNIATNVYSEDPSLLVSIDSIPDVRMYRYMSGLLKSNCRVTSQPDFGDIFIDISGKKVLDEASLLKYIISFRDECHFHEEICETIYKRLYDLLDPNILVVKCLYTRRGGIDICPIRATSKDDIYNSDPDLITSYFAHEKTPRQ